MGAEAVSHYISFGSSISKDKEQVATLIILPAKKFHRMIGNY